MQSIKKYVTSKDYKFLDITKEITVSNYNKYFDSAKEKERKVYAIIRNKTTEFIFRVKTINVSKTNICLFTCSQKLNYIYVKDELTSHEKKLLDLLLNNEINSCDICKKKSKNNAICYKCATKICNNCYNKITKCSKCSKKMIH